MRGEETEDGVGREGSRLTGEGMRRAVCGVYIECAVYIVYWNQMSAVCGGGALMRYNC